MPELGTARWLILTLKYAPLSQGFWAACFLRYAICESCKCTLPALWKLLWNLSAVLPVWITNTWRLARHSIGPNAAFRDIRTLGNPLLFSACEPGNIKTEKVSHRSRDFTFIACVRNTWIRQPWNWCNAEYLDRGHFFGFLSWIWVWWHQSTKTYIICIICVMVPWCTWGHFLWWGP